MTVKEYLKRAYDLNVAVEDDMRGLEKLEHLEHFMTNCQGYCPPETLDKINKLRDDINAKIDKYIDVKNEIRAAIETLSDEKEKRVLRKRYLLFRPWEQIAREMCCTKSWAFEIHKNALENLGKMLDLT